jgi:drug/metabolite transporter (DMT)-like permease
VWSFLLLGETLNRWQAVGIAIVVSGLLAFLVLNEQGTRARQRERYPPAASEGAGPTVI